MIFQIASQLFILFRQEKINTNTKLLFIRNEILTTLLHWWHVTSQKDVNEMHETFLSTFLDIYKTNFPYKQVTVKPKDVKNL